MLGLHIAVGVLLITLNAAAGLVGGIAWYRNRPSIPFWYLLRAALSSPALAVIHPPCDNLLHRDFPHQQAESRPF